MTTPSAPRKCYWLDETHAVEGGFRPSIVVEDEPGHTPTDYVWGPSLAEALNQCEQANAELGIDEKAYLNIVTSSMAASRRANPVDSCSVCSEDITGEPLMTGLITWPDGMEAVTICSPECLELQLENWLDYAKDRASQAKRDATGQA